MRIGLTGTLLTVLPALCCCSDVSNQSQQTGVIMYEDERAFVPEPQKGLIAGPLGFTEGAVTEFAGSQTVRVSQSVYVGVTMEVTSHGGGLLMLFENDTEVFRRVIYDDYREDEVWYEFEGGQLLYEFCDQNNDHVLDLCITGSQVLKSDHGIVGRDPVNEVYLRDTTTRCWKLSSLRSPDYE